MEEAAAWKVEEKPTFSMYMDYEYVCDGRGKKGEKLMPIQ